MQTTVFVRLRLILLGLGVVVALVIVQLLRIDFFSAEYFEELFATMSTVQREFAPERGRIFDRHGELLATNDVKYEISISPPGVTDSDEVAETLSRLLDRSVTEIRTAAESPDAYVLVARPVPAEVGDQIKALRESGEARLNGVDLAPLPNRVYPGGSLAAQVLGFVGYTGEGDRAVGYTGVEGFYNDWLSGRPIQSVQAVVPFDAQLDPEPEQGADLYLTIDRDIQFLVEGSLAQAVQLYGAEGGSIIVLDPRTGEILAMASYPSYNPMDYARIYQEQPELLQNPAVSGQYEPGSTFKILTMAAALDTGLVQPNTPFQDTGYIEVGGVPIRNWNGGAWGAVDMVGCLRHSLNVCMASLSTQLGTTTFYNYLSAFGIGHRTNVDLAAEAGGRLKLPGDTDWYESDLGTNAFGQGVAVTPLQLVAAVGAVANGGVMMQPHILLRVESAGQTHVTQPQVLGRPIRPETAVTLSQMLAQSLEEGEGDQAVLPGYRIAGKTGTAQIPIPGGYDQRQTVASFIGWGPVDDPRFVVLVKLDKPRTSIWGSETAAPAFAALTQRLVVLMHIPPDDARRALAGQ
ncbi:MAG: penicillin-binding protein 2 [Anaerolineales bacterium]|nr:penicillin-binding protein 2 [Anaerolineales bacterium]